MISHDCVEGARRHWDGIAKPLSSLGRLEDVVSRLAGIQGRVDVSAGKKCVLVLCADNGVVAEGVTQTESSVTALVARHISEGNGNINAMARVAGAEVFPVDVGMISEVDHPGIITRKLARGTQNMALGPALTAEQARGTIEIGAGLVADMARRGFQIIATGEMGIGNTTTSSALASAMFGRPVAEMTGRGAGLPDEGLSRKIEVIERALAVNLPDPGDPIDLIVKVGGLDIAGLAGVFIGGMRCGVPIVIDGLISAIAANIAVMIEPESREYMLASHVSREPAGRLALERLNIEPIIEAGMALGEGTGAVALFPLIDMALAVYNQNSTFDMINVPAYQRFEGEKA